jgi:hypothetical protein
MKIHFILIFLSILACLSGCSSSPTPSIEPDSQPNYWYKGIGFQEREKNGILVRAYAAGVDDNVICFYISIMNKSDAPVLTDKADFSLREIAGIPADGEKSLVVGNEEKAAESREFARKLVDQINTESLCQAVSCGLFCTSMFLPTSNNNSRTQENLRYDMDERQERINAKTKELEEKERQVLPKTTLGKNDTELGTLYFLCPGLREAMAAEKQKKLDWDKKRESNPQMNPTPPDAGFIFPAKPVTYLELTYGQGDTSVSFFFTLKSLKK